jgi:hypothetical protein
VSEIIDENTSDGYHTFKELYDHRRALTAALMALADECGMVTWRSREHHPDDSPIYKDYFIVGMEVGGGTITYHYANQYWDDFQQIPGLPHAPKWDGEGPSETVTRLLNLARGTA